MLERTRKARDPVDHLVGARVRLRRMQLGKSQEWLGDALGLTFQQVQKYEKGANRIGAGRLVKIARILQVQVAWFFEGLTDEQTGANDALLAEYCSPALATEFMATADGAKLVKAFMGLSAPVRRKLVSLVCVMANDADTEAE